MIAKLLSFSLKNRLFVFITFLLIIAAGIQSFRQLPVDAFPEISPTQVKIILRAPGMAAERNNIIALTINSYPYFCNKIAKMLRKFELE